MQPLVSKHYGIGDKKSVKRLLKYGIVTSLSFFTLITILIFVFTDQIVALFNSEGSARLADLAHDGIRIYFLGYVFAGINIVETGFLSATSRVKEAFCISMLRGFIAIILSACILAYFMGITGVWASFAVAEGITFMVFIFINRFVVSRK